MLKHITFQSIPVIDQDRALGFYRDRLRFEVHTDAPYAEGWRWIFMTLPNAETRLHFARTTELSVHGVPALCLTCEDVDKLAEELREAGVEITDGPGDAPWVSGVRWLMIKDSEGNLVLLESVKP